MEISFGQLIMWGFIVFTFVLAFFVYVKTSKRKGFSSQELQYIRSHWIRIIDSFGSNVNSAVLDADKLLDYALSKKGFVGSVGEKMKKAGPRFSNLNGIWGAHKLRNRVAHELSDIDRGEAKRALEQFKKALNDLGAKL